MALIVPDEGEPLLLDQLLIVEADPGPVWHLHLYQNDYSPNKTSTLADFTEADFSTYAIVELLRSDWQASAEFGGAAYSFYGVTFIEWFAGSGSQVIYGYYVTDEADEFVLWCERFPTPQTASVVNSVKMQPSMRLRSEVEPDPP